MLTLETTADGSNTLFVPELDEHYHSIKGALTESEHIFIKMGLNHSLVKSPHVLEIGFGTGLNAFLTLLEAEKQQRTVHFTSIEQFPLEASIIHKLTYPETIAPKESEKFYALHTAPWNQDVEISSYFTLHKIKGDFTRFSFQSHYDIVYFDAFAPEKQPEMWSLSLFEKLYQQMNAGGILTTYCAKGTVRRMLQAAGFTVERLPGPPKGKREILRANKK